MSEDDVGSLVSKFLAVGNYKPATKRAYAADLQYFAQSLPEGVGLLTVCPAVVGDYLKTVQASSSRRYRERQHPASPATKARKTACLHRFYKWCVRTERLSVNPVELKVKVIPRLALITSEEDITTLLGRCDSSAYGRRDAALIASMAGLGLKVGQVTNLDANDILVQAGMSGTVYYPKDGVRQSRVLLLPSMYERAITYYLPLRQNTQGAFFQNKFGMRLSQRGVRRIVKKYSDARITCESLRNAFFARLLRQGCSEQMIADLAGIDLFRVRPKYESLGIGMPSTNSP